MRIHQWPSALLFLTLSCHSPESTAPPSSLKAEDTVKDAVQSATPPANDSAVVLLTHLKDTTYAAGNFILFLRPDDARYAELEKDAEDGVGDGDSDFGVGIAATQDSLKQNDRYKDIHLLVSTCRYLYITDCKGGPLLIDRDTVSYGFILSGKGKLIAKTYNSVHSGNYLGELGDYFFAGKTSSESKK